MNGKNLNHVNHVDLRHLRAIDMIINHRCNTQYATRNTEYGSSNTQYAIRNTQYVSSYPDVSLTQDVEDLISHATRHHQIRPDPLRAFDDVGCATAGSDGLSLVPSCVRHLSRQPTTARWLESADRPNGKPESW